MKAEEVINLLSDLGIEITERTLQRYAKEDLITKPNTVSLGRYHGKIADYADDTVSQIKALQASLGLFRRIKKKHAATIRKISLMKLHLIMKGYSYFQVKDIIKLFNDGKVLEFDVKINGDKDIWNHYLKKEVEALKNIPEDIKRVIDLLVANWILVYKVTEDDIRQKISVIRLNGLEEQVKQECNISAFKEVIEEWHSLMNSIISIYSTQRVDQALEYLENMDI